MFAVRVCSLGLDLFPDQEVHLLPLVLPCVSTEPGWVILSPTGGLLLLSSMFWLLPFLHGWRKVVWRFLYVAASFPRPMTVGLAPPQAVPIEQEVTI